MDSRDTQRQPNISPAESLVPDDRVKPGEPSQAPSVTPASGAATPDGSTNSLMAERSPVFTSGEAKNSVVPQFLPFIFCRGRGETPRNHE
jgi:hypothetical protein